MIWINWEIVKLVTPWYIPYNAQCLIARRLDFIHIIMEKLFFSMELLSLVLLPPSVAVMDMNYLVHQQGHVAWMVGLEKIHYVVRFFTCTKNIFLVSILHLSISKCWSHCTKLNTWVTKRKKWKLSNFEMNRKKVRLWIEMQILKVKLNGKEVLIFLFQ